MQVRPFVFEKDYKTIADWYTRWGYHPMQPEIMPKNGLILSNEGHDVCAAFLYLTDGRIGIFEGAVIDPDAPRLRRKGALAFLCKEMQALAKQLGCLQAWIIAKDKTLMRMAKDDGFWCYPNQFNVLMKGL